MGLGSYLKAQVFGPSSEDVEAVKTKVESLLANHAQYPIQVFSKTYCPYCTRAKHLLKSNYGWIPSEYSLVELDRTSEGPAIQSYLAQRVRRDRVTVPQVYVRGQLVGGCDDLLDLEKSGKLGPLIAGTA